MLCTIELRDEELKRPLRPRHPRVSHAPSSSHALPCGSGCAGRRATHFFPRTQRLVTSSYAMPHCLSSLTLGGRPSGMAMRKGKSACVAERSSDARRGAGDEKEPKREDEASNSQSATTPSSPLHPAPDPHSRVPFSRSTLYPQPCISLILSLSPRNSRSRSLPDQFAPRLAAGYALELPQLDAQETRLEPGATETDFNRPCYMRGRALWRPRDAGEAGDEIEVREGTEGAVEK